LRRIGFWIRSEDFLLQYRSEGQVTSSKLLSCHFRFAMTRAPSSTKNPSECLAVFQICPFRRARMVLYLPKLAQVTIQDYEATPCSR
jgi:hypothetical protein